MLNRTKYSLLGMVSAILVCATSPVLAAATQCVIWPSDGTTTYDAKIAVASNFFGPAKLLVTDFTATGQPGAGKHIDICQNATGTLYNEIITGSAGYSLFLAANESTPSSLAGTAYVQSGATEKLYANGIPVLFGIHNASTLPDTHTLIPALSSGSSTSTISAKVTSSQALSTTNSQTVAVANVTTAPYGTAAQNILADMGYTVTNTSIPSWVHSPLYDNIDLTFQSVTGLTNKSGFVSKAQICDGSGGVASGYVAIQFLYNNADSNYLPHQGGILTTSSNGTQDGIGASLFSYMLNNDDPTYWPDFLSNNCYGQISSSPLFLKALLNPHHKQAKKN